ncbi:unnamed protein product [Sphenostylis stenocarpa]|uniref:Uncharacterized protein n=1 Tax=Sphenostylis stenocarpa TaxID=92480 RepID=A0AA86W6D4_9FABA|nr:unnamed protein product [Sphenostylis stenocarpa]
MVMVNELRALSENSAAVVFTVKMDKTLLRLLTRFDGTFHCQTDGKSVMAD